MLLVNPVLALRQHCAGSCQSVQIKREGAGLKCFSGSGTAAVGGKRNNNSSYLSVAQGRTGIGGKANQNPSKSKTKTKLTYNKPNTKKNPKTPPNKTPLVLQHVTKPLAFICFLLLFSYVVAHCFLISDFHNQPIYTQMYERMMLLCVECA